MCLIFALIVTFFLHLGFVFVLEMHPSLDISKYLTLKLHQDLTKKMS